MTRALGMQVVGQAVDATTTQSKYHSALMTGYGAVAQVGVELPFSRSNESEADHIGLVYMARAGYNPEEAVKFWQRFSEVNGKSGGQLWFLSTHPVDEKRIEQIRVWMAEAKKQYRPQM